MMNLSPMGSGFGGNLSSSSSNLSPLAPPFTVDRLNPNFNSSPLLHYSDSPYMVESFNHAWPYARPSAPGPEHVIHSTGEAGVHLSDGYRFTASPSVGQSSAHWSAPSPGTQASGSSFAYGGEIKSYYSPYVPPLVEEDSPLVPNQGSRYNFAPSAGMSRTSQLDYTSNSFDLEYGPRWVDNLGFDDGKRAKRVEVDVLSDKANVGGCSSHNQFDEGGYSTGTWNKSKEAFDFSYQKFNQGYDTDLHTGGHKEAKHLVKDFCLFSDDSKKSNILESSSMYHESHTSILPLEMHNISNYKSSYIPFDKCIRPDDTFFADPSPVLKSSPSVVIRPPPATNVNLGQSTLSHKPTHDNNGEGAYIVDFGHHSPAKQKEISIESSYNYPETNLINFSKQEEGLIPSTSVKEMSSALHCTGTFDDQINTRCVPQLPALTVPGGPAVACGNVQVSNSADVTSDFVDGHNLGVDSPCWKGAPYSKISQFDGEPSNIMKTEKIFGEYSGFDQEENQNLLPIVRFDSVSSGKNGQGKKNNHDESARMDGVRELERTFYALCSSNEPSLLDDARSSVQISTATNNKGVKVGADTDMMRNESSSPINLTDFDMKDCNTKQLVEEEGAGMTPTNASEGGDVAVHAAEKVLDSPASQDAADEHPRLPDSKLNVPTMIKAMHNLSELLLFHLSNHAESLDGESAETLKYISSNLDLCLSKKIFQASDKPISTRSVGDTCEKLGESCNVRATSESPASNEAVNSNIKLGCASMHEEVGSFRFSMKKDKKLPNLPPFMDDLDMTRDDDAAKAIKKILEETFHFDEEMHSQAHLFKSLWLETEAKLCSINYKARFDRMKILMEEAKLQASLASKVLPKAHEGTNLKSTLQDYSFSSIADDAEASVMERFNILKSQEENPKPNNVEEKQQTEMVDGECAPSAVASFNVLKSFEGSAKSIREEEKRETDVVDGEHATSVMARFNILKSREGNSKLIRVEEEEEEEPEMVGGGHAPSVMTLFNILKSCEGDSKNVGVGEGQSEAVDGGFPGGKYAIIGRSEKETLNVAQMPDFHYQIGSLDEGKFGWCVDEFHLSVKNGPMIHPLSSANITAEGSLGGSSSDWEHVLKDEVAWKNL